MRVRATPCFSPSARRRVAFVELRCRVCRQDARGRFVEPALSQRASKVGQVKEPIWLDRADCVAIHELMLAQYGGASGLRSEPLLESALGKPLNRFHYESAGLAASYAAGIVLKHPFVDGNKRTGFMLAATFSRSMASSSLPPKSRWSRQRSRSRPAK